ncbi:hypothetical protein AAC387_Pa05g0897 [Persea americana]
MSSRFEGSIPSAGEGSGQRTTDGKEKLTTEDTLNFVECVGARFLFETEKYEEFLLVMRDFRNGSIDMRGVVSKIEELFKGNQNLIVGFNAFLPKQYEIVLPPKDDPQQ